jgi:phosphoadenosine phosphosulfate reductase
MDLEHLGIERLQAASEMSLMHYGEPLIITDSGGKDSAVIKEMARRAGIPFEVMHNHTTADAPETVRFIRSEAKRFEDMGIKYTINMPVYKGQRTSMWSLIPQKLMPPTRLVRYCCSVLKETGGAGRFIATGVRWAESASRKNSRGIYEKNGDSEHRIILNNDNDDRRMLFENCRLKAKRTVNPIIDWTDDDVWDFLTSDDAPPCNPLYCEGLKRVGCVGCPLADKTVRELEFLRWPKYKDLYLMAFDRMIQERNRREKPTSWEKPTEVFNFWMEYDVLPGQNDLFEMEDYEWMD